MQSKVKIIRTDDGYMVELPDGEYLCDRHGDNLWDTLDEVEDVIATTYVDLSNYIEDYKPRTLMDAQLRAFPDSIVLTDFQMFNALRTVLPDWLADHKYEDWRYYEARYELGYWSDSFYNAWKQHMAEEARGQWARSAFLYKSQYPDGFFYACGKKPDGTYRHVGFRFGFEDPEYASGFVGMEYTPEGESK